MARKAGGRAGRAPIVYGIIAVDDDHAVRAFDPGAREMFGFSAEEILGKPADTLVAPRHRGAFAEWVADGSRRPANARHDIVGLRKDGAEFSARVSVSVLEDGERTLIAFIVDGIAQRVRDSDANFRKLFDNARVGIGVRQGENFVYVNRAYAETLGYDSPDEILAIPGSIDAVIPAHELDRMRQYRVARDRGEPVPDRYEVQGLRKDGSSVWLERVFQEVVWNGRRAFLATSIDISKRKRAEEALRVSEERFRALITNSADIATVVSEIGAILYESPSITRMLGYGDDELIGRDAFALMHPDDAPRVREVFAKLLSDPTHIATVSYRFRHKDGSWRHLESTGQNRLADAAVGGVIINSRDVSERRALEDQLHQARRLEIVGKLAGGVAHEFNNLMTAISCNLEVAREMSQGHEAAPLVERAMASVQRGAVLTKQLLAYSRRQPLRPGSVSVGNVLDTVTPWLKQTTNGLVDIEVVIAEDIWPVWVDQGRLEDALTSLVINSHDAMSNGGAVIIEARNARVETPRSEVPDSLPPGEYVVIGVSDTGPGMVPDVLEHVFEPFYTTKEVGEGTGLGLSMVHGFAIQSGGRVDIKSPPGGGTTVTLYLPKAETEAA